MPLPPLAPGGQWFAHPSKDVLPVYVPAQQLDTHGQRMSEDGWMPIADPRREEDYQPPAPSLLEDQLQQLQAENVTLKAMVAHLTKENAALIASTPTEEVTPC